MLSHSAQQIADALARQIEVELLNRGLRPSIGVGSVIYKSVPIGPSTRYNLGERPDGVFQVSGFIPYDKAARSSKAVDELVRPWAIDLGLKLARPWPITTYALDLPSGVIEAALGKSELVYVRLVTDYLISNDSVVSRLDVLVSWEDMAKS